MQPTVLPHLSTFMQKIKICFLGNFLLYNLNERLMELRRIKMKNRAFTLMEMLIVVLVICVLASIAIPKYTRILENHKTEEAEEILSAVRTEQEARCVTGKNYLKEEQRKDLVALSNSEISRNYQYNLLPKAIEAVRPNKYTLKMWYKTGELCCIGEGCSILNKNYPPCQDDIADECAGPIPQSETLNNEPPEPEPEPLSCGPQPTEFPAPKACNACGESTPSYVCDESTNWLWETVWSECSVANESECKEESPCENGAPICEPGESEVVGCDTMNSPTFPPAGTSRDTGSDLIPALTVRKCAADGCSWEYPIACECPLCSKKTSDGRCLLDKTWQIRQKIVEDCQCDAQGNFINRDKSTSGKISAGSACDTLGQAELVKFHDNCTHLPVSGSCTGYVNYDEYSCGRKCSDSNGGLWSYHFPGHGFIEIQNGDILWDHTDFFK